MISLELQVQNSDKEIQKSRFDYQDIIWIFISITIMKAIKYIKHNKIFFIIKKIFLTITRIIIRNNTRSDKIMWTYKVKHTYELVAKPNAIE